jgi:hypothetical protein
MDALVLFFLSFAINFIISQAANKDISDAGKYKKRTIKPGDDRYIGKLNLKIIKKFQFLTFKFKKKKSSKKSTKV